MAEGVFVRQNFFIKPYSVQKNIATANKKSTTVLPQARTSSRKKYDSTSASKNITAQKARHCHHKRKTSLQKTDTTTANKKARQKPDLISNYLPFRVLLLISNEFQLVFFENTTSVSTLEVCANISYKRTFSILYAPLSMFPLTILPFSCFNEPIRSPASRARVDGEQET